jgi:polyisoprenyl-phosphate glycosyltransferase
MISLTESIAIKVSIVVPVYNSEQILPELLQVTHDAMVGVPFEIILVNDGSSDNSWATINSLSKKYSELRGVCLTQNYGQDNAIMAGLNYAAGEYVVVMDDDLQHSPYDIPKLLLKCEEGYDVCYADYSQDKRQAYWKNFGSFVNNLQAGLLLGKPRDIYLSPFKMVNRVIIDSMLEYENSYPYIDGLIFRVTNSITQIKVRHYERHSLVGNYNMRKSISVFLKHMTGFSILPLRLASLIGLMISAIGLILIGYYIVSYINGNTVEGWTTLAVLQLTIGGAILMSLGVIGEYVGRLYLVANKRPQFIVRRTTFD